MTSEQRYLALDGTHNGLYLTLAEGLAAEYELDTWANGEEVLVEAGTNLDDEPQFDIDLSRGEGEHR